MHILPCIGDIGTHTLVLTTLLARFISPIQKPLSMTPRSERQQGQGHWATHASPYLRLLQSRFLHPLHTTEDQRGETKRLFFCSYIFPTVVFSEWAGFYYIVSPLFMALNNVLNENYKCKMGKNIFLQLGHIPTVLNIFPLWVTFCFESEVEACLPFILSPMSGA